MIPTLFNGMIAIMLVRFMVNAVPHALELLSPPTYNSREVYPDVVLRPISPAEPHILDITYKGRRMIGTVTTETLEDSLLVTQLAVDEPGVVSKGFLQSLGDTLEAIARSKGLRSVKIEYLYQHLGMYKQAGFTPSYEEGEAGMVVRHVSGNPGPAVGTCYEDAWRYLIKQEEGKLIHGTVWSDGGERVVDHAWVELPSGYIWEPQTGRYFESMIFQQTFIPLEEARYTPEEAAIMVARVGKHGPWTAEERMQWIGR